MESYYSTKIYKLVSFYILSHLQTVINNNKIGLYHNDRLVFLWGANSQKIGKTKKNIMEVFKNIRFQTDIATNLKEVNFLDSKWKISSLQKVQQ